jgi:hypothetical protein
VAARKKKNPSVLFDRRSLPRVPAFAPGWDAFYLATFFRILSGAWRRMARLSVLAAGQVDVKASRQNLGMEYQIFSTIEHSLIHC